MGRNSVFAQRRCCIVVVSLLCLMLLYCGDRERDRLLRGSAIDFGMSISGSRKLAEISASGEALNIVLIFICIICAGFASGLTQVNKLLYLPVYRITTTFRAYWLLTIWR